jgi:hypothetical protein
VQQELLSSLQGSGNRTHDLHEALCFIVSNSARPHVDVDFHISLDPRLTIHRLTRWLSTFIAAWFSLKLLQSKSTTAMEGPFTTSTGLIARPKRFAGRTMDLTLFAVTRAFDVVVGELWSQRKARRVAAGKWTKVNPSSLCTRIFADHARRPREPSQPSQTPPSSPPPAL